MSRDVFAYELREVTAEPVVEVAGYRLKPYRLRHPDAPAPHDDARAGLARLLTRAVEPASDSRFHGLGFAILHLARDGTYLLVGRWYEGNNLMSESFRVAGTEQAPTLERLSLFACIWEMAVYTHERHAWMTTTMASGKGLCGAPQYLACRFSGWV